MQLFVKSGIHFEYNNAYVLLILINLHTCFKLSKHFLVFRKEGIWTKITNCICWVFLNFEDIYQNDSDNGWGEIWNEKPIIFEWRFVTGDLRILIRVLRIWIIWVLRIVIRDFAVVVFGVVAVGAVVIDGWIVLRVSLKIWNIYFTVWRIYGLTADQKNMPLSEIQLQL